MAKIALTAKKVEQLRKQPGTYRDAEVKGLLLVVDGPNAASWQLRYEFNGREKWMGLGGVRDVPLAAARERARAKRLLMTDGIDPLDQKRQARAKAKADALRSVTFKPCADQYLAQHSSKWRDGRQLAQWEASLRDYVFPIIGDLPVGAIDTAIILKVLEQPVEATDRYPAGSLWSARRETANRVRGRIEAVLGWAQVRGYRSGDNPARWTKHLSEVLPGTSLAQEHLRAMPWADVPGFVSALRKSTAVAARALEFTILTAARSGEALGAKWDEIDFNQAVWTIPARRMKAGKEHRVPLSPAAIDLLKALYTEEGNTFVFIGSRGGGLAHEAMRLVLRQLGQDVTVHGFRSAFRDWAGERTNFAHDIAEAALAHSRGAVHAAYQRGDLLTKRRKLMEGWASFLASPAKAAGDVVSIKRATAN
jgi:integrase